MQRSHATMHGTKRKMSSYTVMDGGGLTWTAIFLSIAVLLVDGRDEDGLESEIAALLPGLVACSSGAGSAMGPAQRLRAEAVRDVQVCCLRDDVVERVDEVVVPVAGGNSHVALTRAALLDNMAIQPDGRYACLAMVRNHTSAAQAPGSIRDRAVTVVGTVLPPCADGWRCNSAIVHDKCTSVCRCPHGMHAIEGIWRCSDYREPSRIKLEVFDEYGVRYVDGDRVLLRIRDTLVLRYRYEVSADATLLEQVSGEQPWRLPVPFSSKGGAVRRHEGTLVLWEVSRAVAVFLQVSLQSRPPLTKSVMLNLVVVQHSSGFPPLRNAAQLAVGMPCMEDGDCRSVNGLCMERQCRCAFSLDTNGTCIVVGCERNDDCARIPGTVCVESTCRCPAGSELRNGRCWHRACKSHFECARERAHSVCLRNSCLCAHGHRDVDGSCTPIECFHDIECRDPLMRCLNTSCQCSEEDMDIGGRCEPKPNTCEGQRECLEPRMSCSSGKCSCPEGFYPAGSKCARECSCIQYRRSGHNDFLTPTAPGRSRKCMADDDCKWSELCLNRPCVCHRESTSAAGVCLQADTEASTDALGTTSAQKIFAAAAGIGIFLVTAAGLVLFLASLSKNEAMDADTAPQLQDDGGPPVDNDWPSGGQHGAAAADGTPATPTVSETDTQCSLEENDVVQS